ncbi:MAG: hypothetical protein HQK85_05880 [Nitrospinae bacterium]|nr:hypothetical protein [Nitrospinota bacterium]
MNMEEIWRYAYVKRPLTEVYETVDDVPDEFKIEWLKDANDYVRTHSDEELEAMRRFTPEQILNWLEEAVPFVWEAQMARLKSMNERNRNKMEKE